MKTSKIELTTEGARSKVIVDGKDMSHLARGYTLTHYVGEVPTLTLELNALDTTAVGNVFVQVVDKQSLWAQFVDFLDRFLSDDDCDSHETCADCPFGRASGINDRDICSILQNTSYIVDEIESEKQEAGDAIDGR